MNVYLTKWRALTPRLSQSHDGPRLGSAFWASLVYADGKLYATDQDGDTYVLAAKPQFEQLSREYLAGYLAWRPQSGTSLGFHEYDGKLTDFSRELVSS